MKIDTRRDGQSGQVEAETAIVLPIVVFMLLGLIQLGLLHQARLFAKYAAYRAVRTGALRVYPSSDDWIKGMEKAALAAALPILSFDFTGGGGETLLQTDKGSNWLKKWFQPGFGTPPINTMLDLALIPMHYMEVDICGPLNGDVSGTIYSAGGVTYVPFDAPEIAADGVKTKLRIQLTLNYRMIIPFADWVIYRMWRGVTVAKELRLGKGTQFDANFDNYRTAAMLGVHIIPIRVQYAMKLHSDVPVDHFPQNNLCM